MAILRRKLTPYNLGREIVGEVKFFWFKSKALKFNCSILKFEPDLCHEKIKE